MPYTKTEWVDNVTAITAARLNHIEDGIEAAGNFLPSNQGVPGQYLSKTSEGTEWCEIKEPEVTGEVLRL